MGISGEASPPDEDRRLGFLRLEGGWSRSAGKVRVGSQLADPADERAWQEGWDAVDAAIKPVLERLNKQWTGR